MHYPGLPSPFIAHVPPYPTRFHGGIWTRPVFGMPYMPAPQSVFKPDDFLPAAYARYPWPRQAAQAGLGQDYDTRNGVFSPHTGGSGIFSNAINGASTMSGIFSGNSLGISAPEADEPGVLSKIWDAATSAATSTAKQAIDAKVDAWQGQTTTAPVQTSMPESQVLALQKMLNAALKAAGYCTVLDTDGKLGPKTCGANRTLNGSALPGCTTFTAPKKTGCGGGGGGGGTFVAPPPSPVAPLPTMDTSSTSKADMMTYGLIGAAVLVLGGAVYMSRGKMSKNGRRRRHRR